MKKIIDDLHTDFIVDDIPKKYKKYANFPQGNILKKKLNISEYESVVVDFYEWTKEI